MKRTVTTTEREIKFRVWDTYNQRMVEDFYLFEKMPDFYDNPEPYRYYEGYRDCEDGIGKPCYIMQFTGLKDKNGIEIYEGDFIRLHEYGEDVYKEVVFHNGAFCVHGFNWERKTAEVIGNKFQNPDLL